jgi:hypothetical protein
MANIGVPQRETVEVPISPDPLALPDFSPKTQPVEAPVEAPVREREMVPVRRGN